jgi:hypothetical protein
MTVETLIFALKRCKKDRRIFLANKRDYNENPQFFEVWEPTVCAENSSRVSTADSKTEKIVLIL